MTYFIESGERAYVAFRAHENQLRIIEKKLHLAAPIGGGVKVRSSVRPASDGNMYPYYARVSPQITRNHCEEIFYPSHHPIGLGIRRSPTSEQRTLNGIKSRADSLTGEIAKLKRKLAASESTEKYLNSLVLDYDEKLLDQHIEMELLRLRVRIDQELFASLEMDISDLRFNDDHLLSDKLIRLLVREKPRDLNEFVSAVSSQLRDRINKHPSAKYISQVFDIVSEADNFNAAADQLSGRPNNMH